MYGHVNPPSLLQSLALVDDQRSQKRAKPATPRTHPGLHSIGPMALQKVSE